LRSTGQEYEFDFVDKIRVEIICTDELVDSLIDAIVQARAPTRSVTAWLGSPTSSTWCESAPMNVVLSL